MRRDIVSAYAVTAARVGSWVLVSALVFRRLGAPALGILTLVRATIGILSYTSLGLGPALVKMLADAGRAPGAQAAVPLAALAAEDDAPIKPLLTYASSAPEPAPEEPVARIYVTGEMLAASLGVVGIALTGIYAFAFDKLHLIAVDLRASSKILVLLMGAGVVFRLISDAPSALLEARGRIALDNWLLALAEGAWGVLTIILVLRASHPSGALYAAGGMFALANLGLLIARTLAGRLEARSLTWDKAKPDRAVANQLLALGSMIVLAQAADFFYAPTDCILIEHFLGAEYVAYYSPAIQIDAGLLLLVGGLAVVLYPRTAIAHAAGDVARVRRYYLRGTGASFVLLLAAAVAVWALSPWIFAIWFGSDMPQTRAILPLLLVHTVIGGSSAVGRSVLLAVGKTKQFTAAVLIAGVINVLVSFVLVRYAGMGLSGIVMGTIVAVVLRCAVWMPWYVWRTLEEGKKQEARGKRVEDT